MTLNTPNICLCALNPNQEFSAISGQSTGRFLYYTIISAQVFHFLFRKQAFLTGTQRFFCQSDHAMI